MCKAFEIAKYITNNIDADHLKLQKLLFYTQAVSLVKYNSPAFSDKIEAWSYGPVVPNVYKKLKHKLGIIKINSNDKLNLTQNEIHCVDLVLGCFGDLSGVALMNLTHSEKPWQMCYVENKNNEIPNRLISEYYKNIFEFQNEE